MKVKKNIKGMTLTEVMAGAAILLIASLMLASGFGMVIRIMHQGDLIKNAGQLAFGVADGASNTDKKVEDSGVSGGNVEITLDSGKKITAKGSYRSYSVGESPYARFEVLDNTEDVAYTLWLQIEDAYLFGLSLNSKEEREQWGFNGWGVENDGLRRYLYTHVYNKSWPVFPNELLERNGIQTTATYYMQSRYFANAQKANGGIYDPELCALTFARTDPSGSSGWNAPLVYDQTTRTWYYKKVGGSSIVSQDPAGGTGAKAILEQVRNSSEWLALK